MPGHSKLRAARRRQGKCIKCGEEAAGKKFCPTHQKEVNDYQRAYYARKKAAGKCGRCGNRLRKDGACGVCNYAQNVRKRGGTLQGLKDGSTLP